ncbi:MULTISPECIES: PE domain-containing protein [Actinosynnema]|uniref:PE domain-containing protein n=1 Tax=Actinosynnema TaxID=40566 RepID=UPI0020A4A40B|nr:PE domain-containing protein [Actinosynnema pretiosum]MCP2094815.1 PE family protein [Actinosynnema pretiosum]
MYLDDKPGGSAPAGFDHSAGAAGKCAQDVAALLDVLGEAREVHRELAEDLPLGSSPHSGHLAAAFEAHHREVGRALAEAVAVLEDIGANLSADAESYRSAEAEIVALLTKLCGPR